MCIALSLKSNFKKKSFIFLLFYSTFAIAMEQATIIPDQDSLNKEALAKEIEGKPDEAFHLYEKAAALGNIFSHYQLARMHSPGGFKGKDGAAAELYYLKAALDCVLVKSGNLPPDYEKVFLKTQGKCASRLAKIYESDINPDLAKALDYYKIALVSDPKSNTARLGLAALLLRLDGGDKETKDRAKQLLTGITDHALTEAHVLLGQLSLQDEDFKSAIAYYNRAANAPEARYQLGLLSERGQGLPAPDVDNALRLYREAAEQGHSKAIEKLLACTNHPGALCVIGRLNRLGIGMPKNEKSAIELLMRSCRGKCREAFSELLIIAVTEGEACYCIAKIYQENIGEILPHIQPSLNEGLIIMYYNDALKKGHAPAYIALKELADAGNINATQHLLNYLRGRNDEWAIDQRDYLEDRLRMLTDPCQADEHSKTVSNVH